MSSLPAGWYKDPADPSTQRWWDGEGWLGKALPADQTPPDGPPPAEEPTPSPPPASTASPVSPAATASPAAPASPAATASPAPVTPATPPASSAPPAPPLSGPPPGWGAPPPGWQAPPQGWQGPPQGPPPGWQGPPQGPPPGWQGPPQGPPPGWQGAPQGLPPGWQGPPPGLPPQGWQAPPPGWGAPPPGYPPLPFAYPVQARPHGLALAGLGRRLVARLIDIVVVFLLNVVVNGWLAYQLWLEIEPTYRAIMADPLTAETDAASPRASWIYLTMLVVATALWCAYEVPALANSGQTLGKRLMGIKVMKLDDTAPLGGGRAFARWSRLGMWTPLWSCYVGFLAQLIYAGSVLFEPKLHQALHDKSARTVVVAVPPRQFQQAETSAEENDTSGGRR
ncbi:RDD family protein [Actinoplanes sp. RD1]|uniref:RDD family protein n=1 Tax=Actinoplanes sp. RD1 TaxID=3064538 RepID=UPI002741FB16|nr:RDD family protein [Actinoplanes sp. RD1]